MECFLKQAVITGVNAKILDFKLQILKNLDVIEEKRLQICNHLKQIVLDATILVRK